MIPVKNKYYNSPNFHTIHFALDNDKPFAYKYDKRKLLEDLYKECINLGVDIRLSSLVITGKDNTDYVEVTVKDASSTYTLKGKKLIIAEGANARLTGVFGLNKDRMYFATALVNKYIMKGITGIEDNSWNLFYGKAFYSNAAIIIGPSLYGNDTYEVTISGSQNLKPDTIFNNVSKLSPLKDNFKNAELVDKQGCFVKAFSSLKHPYKGNVIVIGDSSAFVEVEVQGAFMCGYHAANAIFKELKGEKGFEDYEEWWRGAFEFNSDEYLRVSQGYALVPTYTDEELDYLFGLTENEILEGTYSQYKTPQ